MTPTKHIWIITAIATLGGLIYGFDTGAISGVLNILALNFGLTDADYGLKGWIVSIVLLGALCGALSSSFLALKLGRKRSIITVACVYFIALLGVVLAQALWLVIVGRLFIGWALGLGLMIVPMYLSEIAPTSIRGAVVFCFQLALTLGILLGVLVSYAMAGAHAWRMVLAVGLIPALILGLGMLRLPESPRWLLLKSRLPEAQQVLQYLLQRQDVSLVIQEMQESLQHKAHGYKALFSGRMLPLFIVAFGLFAFQQLSGINAILYFAPALFQQAGFTGASAPLLAAVSLSIVNVLATICGVWVVDRLGRRKLLFLGLGGTTLCLLVVGAAYQGYLGAHAEWLTLGAVLVYIVCFAIGLGGVPFIMMSELFPLAIRGPGMSLSSCACWVFNFIIASTFLALVHALGAGYAFWLYAGFCFIGLIFAYCLAPETKGVSLEHIEANLYAGKRLRDLGK